MTDNEKAATFIGWKENEECWVKDCSVAAFFDSNPDGYCNCGFRVSDDPYPDLVPSHIKPSPDMADPRNYMKALEELHRTMPYFKWSGDKFGISTDWEDGWIWARSIVGLLAQLYDMAAHHAGMME